MEAPQQSLKIGWDDALSSGVRSVDVQHRYFIDIVNELAEAIESGQAAIKVRRILNLMAYYADWHFEREELCMDRYQCPAAEANKQAHKNFLNAFESFEANYRQSGGSEEIALRMYQVLTDWLVKHILGTDGKLKDCIHEGDPEYVAT
jgi:hemerythrin